MTADHGNAELMSDPGTGRPHTAHTTNPVPFAIFGQSGVAHSLQLRVGGLADIAPTLLRLMGLPVPPDMAGFGLLTSAPGHAPA